MQKLFRIFVICLIYFAIVGSPLAGPSDDFDELISKGKKLIEEGVHKWDETILMEARSLFERLLQNEEMKWLTHYYIGYADYRLAIYYQEQNKRDLLIKYLDDGIEHLEASIGLKDNFADSHALLSSLLGQKISTDPALGMTLGYKSGAALSDAKGIDDKNPRVALISAISSYYTPEQFGGSKTRALEEMKQSVELFKKEKLGDARLPDWGHSEALAWLGKFYLDEQKWQLAKQNLEEALKIDPQNGFAKLMQNQLEQQ
ncbi:MAG: hypothetical protein ACE5JB_03355 [bacterium]